MEDERTAIPSSPPRVGPRLGPRRVRDPHTAGWREKRRLHLQQGVRRYTVTPRWVEKLARELEDPKKHRKILGRRPTPL